MIQEYLAKNKNFTIGKWFPCPPINDRTAWDFLPSFDSWLEAGNSAARKKVPPIPLSLWLNFSQNGDRDKFEDVYFSRRRMLVQLVMAECMANSGTFLPKIADVAWTICEESAWQLPAHNSYKRDAPQLALPDTKHPVVDLFAAETAALLAMVFYLLGKKLDSCAPAISKRIAQEVEARTLSPWRKTHFWWMGNGEAPMCNWTPWCTQNLLIATAILHPNNSTYIRQAVTQAAYSTDCFLKDYGDDGCCNEGAQYYSHAGLTLYNLLSILCALAPGVFDGVWQQEKIKNIAEYIVYMHISGSYYFNFADCSPLAGFRGVREYLFGKKIASDALSQLAAADFAKNPDPYTLHSANNSEGINLLYAVQTAFAEKEIRLADKTSVPSKDIWYASNGLRTVHRGTFSAGIKAGNNADSHNHNDTGSITLYKNNLPLLIDIGVETYSKKTFSPQRYAIWTMQSAWHNLPTFVSANGEEYSQHDGIEFAADCISVLPNGLSMNIAKAYGNVPSLSYYKRTVEVTDTECTLQDETDYSGSVLLSFISVEKPVLQKERIRLGSLGNILIHTPTSAIHIEEVAVKDCRLRLAWPALLYRTRICFSSKISLVVK